jgi:hypothetical protein
MKNTDTPRTDACPHCGAGAFELPVEGYKCGTEPWYDDYIGSCLVRGNSCYANQNSQLKAEVAELKESAQRIGVNRYEQLKASQAEVEHIKALLKDPSAVHINTLRGTIAGLSWDGYEHILGPHPCRERAEKAEAEVERLRVALQSCYWATNTYDGNYTRACDNVATIAINALKTQDK